MLRWTTLDLFAPGHDRSDPRSAAPCCAVASACCGGRSAPIRRRSSCRSAAPRCSPPCRSGATIVLGRVTDELIVPGFETQATGRGDPRRGARHHDRGAAPGHRRGRPPLLLRRDLVPDGRRPGARRIADTYLAAPLSFHQTRPTGELMAHADIDTIGATEAINPVPFSIERGRDRARRRHPARDDRPGPHPGGPRAVPAARAGEPHLHDPRRGARGPRAGPLRRPRLGRPRELRRRPGREDPRPGRPRAGPARRRPPTGCATSACASATCGPRSSPRSTPCRTSAPSPCSASAPGGSRRARSPPASWSRPWPCSPSSRCRCGCSASCSSRCPGRSCRRPARRGPRHRRRADPRPVGPHRLPGRPARRRGRRRRLRLPRRPARCSTTSASRCGPARSSRSPAPPGRARARSATCSPASSTRPAGRVEVGGVDLTVVDPDELRASVALVFQETFLFADTVQENLTLSEPVADATVDWAAGRGPGRRVRRRARPTGCDTIIGERGVTLSGGQRQRLALARALLRHPRLLILDDATSAVDPRIEQQILAGLRRELDMTTLVVAHRVSTIALADRVLYLDDGRLVADGTHAELLATVPGYEALVRAYEADASTTPTTRRCRHEPRASCRTRPRSGRTPSSRRSGPAPSKGSTPTSCRPPRSTSSAPSACCAAASPSARAPGRHRLHRPDGAGHRGRQARRARSSSSRPSTAACSATTASTARFVFGACALTFVIVVGGLRGQPGHLPAPRAGHREHPLRPAGAGVRPHPRAVDRRPRGDPPGRARLPGHHRRRDPRPLRRVGRGELDGQQRGDRRRGRGDVRLLVAARARSPSPSSCRCCSSSAPSSAASCGLRHRADPGRRHAVGVLRVDRRCRGDPGLRRAAAGPGGGWSSAIDAQYRAEVRGARFFAIMFPLGDVFGAVALSLVVAVGVWNGPAWGLTPASSSPSSSW